MKQHSGSDNETDDWHAQHRATDRSIGLSRDFFRPWERNRRNDTVQQTYEEPPATQKAA